MKKISLILIGIVSIFATSCTESSKISDKIVVSQINIIENGQDSHKYEVELKTNGHTKSLYYTNHRYQVGDTLDVLVAVNENTANLINKYKFQADSLRKELQFKDYYLSLLKEKIIFDSIKK